MISRITQSFQKDSREYFYGKLCGNIMRERWIKDRLIVDPHAEPGAMALGSYFEFVLSLLIFPSNPSLPKDGKTPVAQFKVRSKGRDVSDMMQDYRDAHANALHVQQYFREMGIEVIGTQVKLRRDELEGTLDLICLASRQIDLDGVILEGGEEFIIDLKYSGLLSDSQPRSNKHGWKWSDVQKKYHGTQAIHYSYVAGGKMKFFFLVVNSSNGDGDCKFFYVPVTEFETEQHLKEGRMYLAKMEWYKKIGFEPRPHFMTCRKCPLRSECPDKKLFPQAEVVNLTNE